MEYWARGKECLWVWAVIKGVEKESPSEMETFEQTLEGGQRVSHLAVQGGEAQAEDECYPCD